MTVSYKKITGNGAADYYLNCSDTPTAKRDPAKNQEKTSAQKFGNQTHSHRVGFALLDHVDAKEEKRVRK